ncbi:hypothetical protein J3A83DRAFT_4368225 [Scleroderma citrinum]
MTSAHSALTASLNITTLPPQVPSLVGPQRTACLSALPVGLVIPKVLVLHEDGMQTPKSESWKEGEPWLGLHVPLKDWPHHYYNGQHRQKFNTKYYQQHVTATEFIDKCQENKAAFFNAYGSAICKGHMELWKTIMKFKNKVSHHAARFKSTEEGINPNDPECCWNLLEQVTAKFLFWVDCNCMWHSNPTYDACLFNPTPSTNQSGDFLSIIKHGGATAAPTPSGSTQGQSSDHTNMAAEKLGNGHFRGTTTHNYTNTSRTAGTPMGELEEDEDEDEEEEEQVEKNRGNKGEIFGGFSYDPIDILPGPKLAAPVVVDEQQEIRDNTTPQASH